jgi:hypothetical protein
MLRAGRLLAVPVVIIFVPLAVALCSFAAERAPASWPRSHPAPHPGEPDAAAADRPARRDASGAAVLAMIVIALAFGVWQAVYRSEQVFVTSERTLVLRMPTS